MNSFDSEVLPPQHPTAAVPNTRMKDVLSLERSVSPRPLRLNLSEPTHLVGLRPLPGTSPKDRVSTDVRVHTPGVGVVGSGRVSTTQCWGSRRTLRLRGCSRVHWTFVDRVRPSGLDPTFRDCFGKESGRTETPSFTSSTVDYN